MNPNPQVYGAPETWDYSFINGGLTTDAANALKIQKAKVPKFPYEGDAGYWTSQLRIGIEAGKITQNVPIDKTVCTVGMGRDCPFATMGYFRRRADTEKPSDVMFNSIASVGNGGVVNGFLWEMRDESAYGTYNLQSAGGGQIDEKQIEFRCWSPESNSIRNTNKQNGNYFIAPYTYYQLKTFIASVEVNVCNSADVPDDPIISGVVPEATWRPIDTWKNSYSTHKITGFRLNFARANSILDSGGRITYTRPSPPSSYKYSVPCGFGLLDEIQFDDEYDYKRYMYALFNDSASGGSWNTVIFKPFTDTVWNSSVHRVAFMGMYDIFNGDLKYLPSAVWYQIDYSDDVYEKLCRAAATFGFIFVTDGALTLPSAMNTDNICFPVINDEGIAHGDYTRGADNLTNDIYNADSTRDKNYNPTTPKDTNTYSLTTSFNNVGHVASTTKAYVVNGNALTGLSTEMWNILNNLVTTPDDMKNLDNLTLDAFLTNNPIDAIVSVKKFPLSSVPHAENLENIYLGKYQASAAGYALALQQARYNFEGIPIFPKFGNCFLDYSPYTKMQLYVPFCGTIDIDAADFMGRTLSVEMVIDFITGSVTAYVLANQLVVTSLTGTCAIDIPITGTEQSTVSASLENAIIQEKSARGSYTLKGSVGGMLTNLIGNIAHPTSAIENRFNTKLQTMQANYNLQHVEMPLRQIGNASPLNSWALEFVCRLIIYYPDGECISFNATNEPSLITDKVQAFGAINGFATVETDTLSSFTGFTQVSDVDLSGISATDTEKEMIANLLQTGVYL